jgi:hypothetical protein
LSLLGDCDVAALDQPGAATIMGSIPRAWRENRMVRRAWLSLFGSPALTEDGAFFSPTTGILPYGREVSTLQLDGTNLGQITMLTALFCQRRRFTRNATGQSQTARRSAVNPNGVMDLGSRPVEPLQLRLTLDGKF